MVLISDFYISNEFIICHQIFHISRLIIKLLTKILDLV